MHDTKGDTSPVPATPGGPCHDSRHHPALRALPGLPPPPEQQITIDETTRGYCSPCLVALYDLLVDADASQLPLPQVLRESVRTLVATLSGVTWDAAERGQGFTLEQLRAQHAFGWTDSIDGAAVLTPGDPATPPRAFETMEAFYAARSGRWSGEADYGSHHTAGSVGVSVWCRWRVSVVATTGDVYASAPCSCPEHAHILLLGSVQPDPLYRDADRRFDGWADALALDLTWFRERAAAPHRVVSPSAGPVTALAPRPTIPASRALVSLMLRFS